MDPKIQSMVVDTIDERLSVHVIPTCLGKSIVPESSLEVLICDDIEKRDVYRQLVYESLLFIYSFYVYRSIGPTLDEIRMFLLETFGSSLIKPTEDDLSQFARELVLKSLCNDGKPFDVFQFSHVSSDISHVNVQLVVQDLDRTGRYSYRLTPETLNYIYRTLEINDYAQDFSVEAVLLHELASHGNYSQGRLVAEQMLQAITHVRSQIKFVRDNVQSLSVVDFRSNYGDLKRNTEAIYGNEQFRETVHMLEDSHAVLEEAENTSGLMTDEVLNAHREFRRLLAVVSEIVIQRDLLNSEFTEMFSSNDDVLASVLVVGFDRDVISATRILEDFSAGIVDLSGFYTTGIGFPLRLLNTPKFWSPLLAFEEVLSLKRQSAGQQRAKALGELTPERTDDDYWSELLTDLRDSFCNYLTKHGSFLASDWIESLSDSDGYRFFENHRASALLSEIWQEDVVNIKPSLISTGEIPEVDHKTCTWLAKRLLGKATYVQVLLLDETEDRAYTFTAKDYSQRDVIMSNFYVVSDAV